jgi:hypothetical protein
MPRYPTGKHRSSNVILTELRSSAKLATQLTQPEVAIGPALPTYRPETVRWIWPAIGLGLMFAVALTLALLTTQVITSYDEPHIAGLAAYKIISCQHVCIIRQLAPLNRYNWTASSQYYPLLTCIMSSQLSLLSSLKMYDCAVSSILFKHVLITA